jgi:hypothetical protein
MAGYNLKRVVPKLPSTDLQWLPAIIASLCLSIEVQNISAQTWTQTGAPSNYWQCVSSSADGKLLAAGSSAKIYLSTNSGADWQPSGSPSANWYALAASADGSRLIAGVSSGSIYLSTNSGATWTANPRLPFGDWRSVASSADGQKLAAAVWGGHIYTSTDAGNSWITNVIPVAAWISLASSADGNTLVTGIAPSSHPFVLASTNAGATWVSNGIPFYCSDVAASADGRTMFCVVLGFGIYASTNSGNTWNPTGAPNKSWRSVATSSDGTIVLAVDNNGSSGEIYTSTNAGVTWVSNNVASQIWNAGAISADGHKMVAVAANLGFTTGPIYTSQTLPAPQLNIGLSNSELTFSWLIPSTNFVLQESADLVNWSAVAGAPMPNFTNLQNQVTLPALADHSFFRLSTP